MTNISTSYECDNADKNRIINIKNNVYYLCEKVYINKICRNNIIRL